MSRLVLSGAFRTVLLRVFERRFVDDGTVRRQVFRFVTMTWCWTASQSGTAIANHSGYE
jgi:hypothetical protein